jgi:hypothetical protein
LASITKRLRECLHAVADARETNWQVVKHNRIDG